MERLRREAPGDGTQALEFPEFFESQDPGRQELPFASLAPWGPRSLDSQIPRDSGVQAPSPLENQESTAPRRPRSLRPQPFRDPGAQASRVHRDGGTKVTGSQSGLNCQDHWEAGRKPGSWTSGLVFFASALCYQDRQGLVWGGRRRKRGLSQGQRNRRGQWRGLVGGEEMRLPHKGPLCCPIP